MQEKPLSKEDFQFLDSIHEKFTVLLNSENEMLELESMNSYQRRLVHKMASNFNLKSQSVGETDRYVCVVKTEDSHIPKKEERKSKDIYNYGNQIFLVTPDSSIILKSDGSVGIPRNAGKFDILDERVVLTSEFKVKNNKIVCEGDKEW